MSSLVNSVPGNLCIHDGVQVLREDLSQFEVMKLSCSVWVFSSPCPNNPAHGIRISMDMVGPSCSMSQ